MINPKFITTSVQHGKKFLQDHNARKYQEPHIDPNGNYVVWSNEKLQEFLAAIFKDVIEHYNEKQSREDRKKDLESFVEKNMKNAREVIVMVGKYGQKPDEETAHKILKEFVDGWKERNPSLYVFGCYGHFDEKGGYHAHIDYIPVASSYERGLEKNVSLKRALAEMGFETGRDEETGKFTYAVVKWQNRERKVLDEICEKHGLKVYHPEIEYKKHMEIKAYKLQKMVDELEEKIETLREKEAVIHSRNKELDELVEEDLQNRGSEVVLTREEYEELAYGALAYDSLMVLADHRAERLEELERTLDDYKHQIRHLEKAQEKLEEKVEDYEEYLYNVYVAEGVTCMEDYKEKKKKKTGSTKVKKHIKDKAEEERTI